MSDGALDSPRCWRCGRATYDPAKRERPWARAVAGGAQVLICPACQQADPDWPASVDSCVRCGSTRLSAMLGEVVCRACGALQSEPIQASSDSHYGP